MTRSYVGIRFLPGGLTGSQFIAPWLKLRAGSLHCLETDFRRRPTVMSYLARFIKLHPSSLVDPVPRRHFHLAQSETLHLVHEALQDYGLSIGVDFPLR